MVNSVKIRNYRYQQKVRMFYSRRGRLSYPCWISARKFSNGSKNWGRFRF